MYAAHTPTNASLRCERTNRLPSPRQRLLRAAGQGAWSARARHRDRIGGQRCARGIPQRGRHLVQRLSARLAIQGFKTADAIGARIGLPHPAPMRVQAGVRHTLQEIASHGHGAAWHDALTRQATTRLEVPAPVVEQAIVAELDEDRLIADRIKDRPARFLPPCTALSKASSRPLRIGKAPRFPG